MRKKNRKPPCRKIVLRLPDLDQAKSGVLNSLSSPRSRRKYKFAMEQFITWYCSELRLALNRAVVLRFRLYLESLGLAAGTINQRLAAVRRLAYEAADSGLLSPELAAGIRRVKGVKQLGSRSGNWLTHDQARLLLEKADGEDLRRLRDLAIISVLLGCGCGELSLPRSKLKIYRSGKNIGRSWTWLARAVIFGPYRCLSGSKRRSIVGCWRPRSTQDGSLGPLAVTEHRGVKESPRMLSGTWFGDVRNGCNWIISLRMTFAERARSFAILTAAKSNKSNFCWDTHPYSPQSVISAASKILRSL